MKRKITESTEELSESTKITGTFFSTYGSTFVEGYDTFLEKRKQRNFLGFKHC